MATRVISVNTDKWQRSEKSDCLMDCSANFALFGIILCHHWFRFSCGLLGPFTSLAYLFAYLVSFFSQYRWWPSSFIRINCLKAKYWLSCLKKKNSNWHASLWGHSEESQVQMLLYADDVTTSKSVEIESTKINDCWITLYSFRVSQAHLCLGAWQWHE